MKRVPLKSWTRQHYKLLITSAFLILVVIAGAGLLVNHHKKTTDLNNVHVVVGLVSKHFVLPTNEVPALATITDTSKLSSKFLKQATNGDKVLIYQKNQIAIIYRPSINRIIAVGPVQIDTPPSATTPAVP